MPDQLFATTYRGQVRQFHLQSGSYDMLFTTQAAAEAEARRRRGIEVVNVSPRSYQGVVVVLNKAALGTLEGIFGGRYAAL